ncbi:ABC transporter substrate-binding protein [Macrococcus capreoli]|uniref:ABC transporter substrate-binding protein n=1 Tax=Macrococcus capreoli TaxID=2982690 RepID=UPI003EE5CD80
MIDKRLLKLERFLESNEPLDSLHDYFGMSQRNMSRLLKKWEAENYIELNTRVHSNKSISLKIDVEKQLFLEFISLANNMKIQDIKSYLELPWHSKSIEAIQSIMKEKILGNRLNINHEKHTIIDYVEQIPEKIDPNHNFKLILAQVCSQIGEKLYVMDEYGHIKRNLVKYEEWIGDHLHIYLHSNIKFSDGTLMTATDVKNTLFHLTKHDILGDWFKLISDIKIVDDFYLILRVADFKAVVQYLLTEHCSVILKAHKGTYIGTGPYRIDKIESNRIELITNDFYRTPVDVNEIYLIKNEDMAREKQLEENEYNHLIVNEVINEIVMFNSAAAFNNMERYEIMAYLKRLMSNDKQAVILPDIKKTINVLLDVEISNSVKEKLKKSSLNFNFVEVKEYHSMLNQLAEADLVWLSESYWNDRVYHMLFYIFPGKSREWYSDNSGAKEFYEALRKDSIEEVREALNVFEKWLEDNHYRELLKVKKQKRIYDTKYKNVSIDQYGVVNYSGIIV